MSLLIGAGVVIATLAVLGSAGHGAATSPKSVAVQGIHLQIIYPGGAVMGGFGPAMQDGCWGCATSVAPGTTIWVMEMLTDNHSATALTVTSMTVGSPFALVSGPHLPTTVPAGRMWMFEVGLVTPNVGGDYTVEIQFATG